MPYIARCDICGVEFDPAEGSCAMTIKRPLTEEECKEAGFQPGQKGMFTDNKIICVTCFGQLDIKKQDAN